MSAKNHDEAQAQLHRIFLGLAFFWCAVIAVLAGWSSWQTYSATMEGARASAAESFRKDVIYRSWAAMHGGVYVPVTAQTPPNPDLVDLPERDISTPSGIKLTLVNPAYMTRQVHELGNKDTGSKGHLTSLTPIRAENAADAWETQALQDFARGAKEASSIEPIGPETYFRFMRPLWTEAACLKCHEKQGYKLGDIRGGISASIPWAPYRESMRTQILANVGGYAAIWAIGFVGLGLGRRRLQDDLSERMRVEDALRVSEQQLQTAVQKLESGNTELKQLNDRLAQSQVRLLQSEKMAAVGQLAAGIAHEINNPIGFVSSNLGTLKCYIESLLDLVEVYERRTSAKGEQDQAALQLARDNADFDFMRDDAMALVAESSDGLERVKKIIQDLRDFSRIDSIDWQESDLTAGLEATINVLSSELMNKVEVIRNFVKLPPVRCHQAQINQVFLNLLMNAVQSIAEKGQISLSSGVEGDWVWVSVQDSGRGMPPEVQKRIFEPFFSTRTVGQGIGLGLSVAYDIVKQHGGRIEVSSEPGRGTRIEVWLPVHGPQLG